MPARNPTDQQAKPCNSSYKQRTVNGERVDGERVGGERVDGERVDGERVDGVPV